MIKCFAVKVEAEASSKKLPADVNQTGCWILTATPTTVPIQSVTSDKGPLLQSATAMFAYVGGSTPSGPLPIVTSSVELAANKSSFTVNDEYVLLEDDNSQDGFGNRLKVSECSSKMGLK